MKDELVTQSNPNFRSTTNNLDIVENADYKETENASAAALKNEVISTYDTMKPPSRFSLKNARKRRIMNESNEKSAKALQYYSYSDQHS